MKTVINYQLPTTLEQYIHRVGRTARAGRSGRSISLADEENRKMVREIVRNARDPVKNRAIPQHVLAKYAKKVTALEPELTKVEQEEKADREIAALENRTNRMQNQLKGGEDEQDRERTWFKDRKKEEEGKGKQTRKKKKRVDIMKQNLVNFEDEDEKKAYFEGEYISRESRRNRRPQKIRTMVDDDDDEVRPGRKGGGGGSKKKGQSAFEEDLANVSRKNVKKMRHFGNQAKRENFGGGGRGGRGRGGRGGGRGRRK